MQKQVAMALAQKSHAVSFYYLQRIYQGGIMGYIHTIKTHPFVLLGEKKKCRTHTRIDCVAMIYVWLWGREFESIA